MLTRRALIGFAAAAPLAFASARIAAAMEPETYQSGGLAIQGYDPVGYFTEQREVKGSPDFTVTYKGATWQFSSAANRDAFESDPARYAPEFGGYCAWAASQGYLAPIQPDAWTVHNGKLYLNANKRIRRRWLRDVDANIAKGEANWPAILG